MEIAVYVLSAMASESVRMAGDPEVESRTSEEAKRIPKSLTQAHDSLGCNA